MRSQFRTGLFRTLPWAIFVSTLLSFVGLAPAQTVNTGATFGEVINLGGEPRDLVLDELRGRVYLVNSNASRIDVYNYREKRLENPIQVGNQPIAAAMSMDNAFLYVTNNASSTLVQIDLGRDQISNIVSLPARPEGVAVGVDGRVLITTQGTGIGNTANTLLLFDPRQDSALQLTQVPTPATLGTPNPLPPVVVGRPALAFPGRLARTPDGNFIIGMVAINQSTNQASTVLFVYEVASGTVLRNRSVTGQSTVLAVSPDGARFMAGSTLYETASLSVQGQFNVANLPFFLNGNFSQGFNNQFNDGGSAFSPDAETVYASFNNSGGAAAPVANVLLVANSRNLGSRLGIKLPESVRGRMVISSDGADLFSISNSGILYLPVSTLFDYPILQPDATQIFLAIDDCNRGIARTAVRIGNLGKGRLTFAVPNPGAALVAQISTGVAPATITLVMEPGRSGVTRQAGTNLYTGASTNTGNPLNIVLSSLDAINLPPVIRVYMNFRNPDQRGVVYPIPTNPNNNAQGLIDMVLDEPRGRLYISNAGFNRIEVFDTRRQRLLQPIEVGQLPRAMAMSLDGSTLYVGNAGGENIQLVDLETSRVVDKVNFPPIPRAGNAAPIAPEAMAVTTSGLQFIMSNGSMWRLTGSDAVLRSQDTVRPVTFAGPRYMAASSDGRQLVVLSSNNNGSAYLFDGVIDNFTAGRQIYGQAVTSYFGPLAAGPGGGYFLAGGQILSQSLVPVGGAERPGAQQVQFPTQPGQPPTITTVSAGQRNVASVFPLSETRFLRATTPVRQNITTATRDDARTTLELVDIRTQSESVAAVLPENPQFTVFGATRINVPSRQMILDARGENAYAISISGLTVLPLRSDNTTQPRLPAGIRAVVNSNDGTPNFRPGSFVSITGTSLASTAAADSLPLPTVLGGACVTLNDVPLPLINTSPTQISAQIPENVRPGQNVLQVRSLATAQSSEPIVVTVQRAP